MRKIALILAALPVAVTGGAVELDMDNFSSELEGKNAFVKFLAPW